MFPLIQAQKDVFTALLSAPRLLTVNVVLQRKMQEASEIDYSGIVTTPRNGCAGIGILVEMPSAKCESPNVSGPVLDWVFSMLVLEVPVMNFAPPRPGRPACGSGIDAETCVQIVLEEIHLLADDFYGTFRASSPPVQPANGIIPGTLGYRVAFELVKGKNIPTPRTGQLQSVQSAPGAPVALACAADPAAVIYYTVDGSAPGTVDGGNTASHRYTGPLPLAAGAQLRARGWAAGKLGSAVLNFTVA